MSDIKNSIIETIGNTPVIRLSSLMRKHRLEAELLVKAEGFNPSGSIKDRAAVGMLEDAEKRHLLKPGGTVIEPTSGNTGIGLAMAAAVKGYRVILTMPESMSLERRQLLQAYGAELVLTPAADGMAGAVKRAEELLAETENSFMPSQFSNPANPASHQKTAEEIFSSLDGCLDCLVATAGTGGTVTGTGRALKKMIKGISVVAVEPFESPLITEGRSGPHKIQGIGANFIPENLDLTVCDEVVTVKSADAEAMARELVTAEGIFAGISSGAAVAAAIDICRRSSLKGKRVLAILPDGGAKYLSTGIFD